MPMERWIARAAGGTSQRLKPGRARIRSLSSSPATGGLPLKAVADVSLRPVRQSQRAVPAQRGDSVAKAAHEFAFFFNDFPLAFHKRAVILHTLVITGSTA